jgi:hypothetical protein
MSVLRTAPRPSPDVYEAKPHKTPPGHPSGDGGARQIPDRLFRGARSRHRAIVETAINRHLSQHKLKILKVAEESEREISQRLAGKIS